MKKIPTTLIATSACVLAFNAAAFAATKSPEPKQYSSTDECIEDILTKSGFVVYEDTPNVTKSQHRITGRLLYIISGPVKAGSSSGLPEGSACSHGIYGICADQQDLPIMRGRLMPCFQLNL